MIFFCEDKIFIALIGDIKDSRNLDERKAAQGKLRQSLSDLNEKYAKEITSRFLITLGDEFQGLLCNADHLLYMIQEIKMSLYPVEVRFGIGIGKITTEIDTDMALGADGPGYYCARYAIDCLKEKERRSKSANSDTYIDGLDVHTATLINTIFEMMKAIEEKWTEKQRLIIWDMLQYGDTQEEVAKRHDITQSAVNRMLSRGNYYVYESALKNVSKVLGEEIK